MFVNISVRACTLAAAYHFAKIGAKTKPHVLDFMKV
jgi:hypothetical protein